MGGSAPPVLQHVSGETPFGTLAAKDLPEFLKLMHIGFHKDWFNNREIENM